MSATQGNEDPWLPHRLLDGPTFEIGVLQISRETYLGCKLLQNLRILQMSLSKVPKSPLNAVSP